MVGDPITLVNRTSDVLSFVADGRHYRLEPGENHGFVSTQARFALAQNPLMGTEDYATLTFQSKVGVKGSPEYPCDPLSDEALIADLDAVERLDRSSIGGTRAQAKAEKIRHPRRPMVTMAGANSLSVGGGA